MRLPRVFVMAMTAILVSLTALTGGEEATAPTAKSKWEPKLPHANKEEDPLIYGNKDEKEGRKPFCWFKFVLVYRGDQMTEVMRRSLQVFEEEQQNYRGRVDFLLVNIDNADRSLCPSKELPSVSEYWTVNGKTDHWRRVTVPRLHKDGTPMKDKDGKPMSVALPLLNREWIQYSLRERWEIEPAATITTSGTRSPAVPPTQGSNGNGNGTRTGGGGGQN